MGWFSSIWGSSSQTEEDSTYKKYKREIDKFSLEQPPIVKQSHQKQLVKPKEVVSELDNIESIEDVMKHFGATEKSTQKPLAKK
jgi:hypothetical protein